MRVRSFKHPERIGAQLQGFRGGFAYVFATVELRHGPSSAHERRVYFRFSIARLGGMEIRIAKYRKGKR